MNMLPTDHQQPWNGQASPGPGWPRLRPLRFGTMAGIAVLVGALATLAGSFYTVQPTEMAGVRRLGTSSRRSRSARAFTSNCRSSTR